MGGPRRFKVIPVEYEWNVEQTKFGTLVIRDADGHDPLDDSDPLTRACNLYLASSAPVLKQALQVLLRHYTGERIREPTWLTWRSWPRTYLTQKSYELVSAISKRNYV